MLTASQNYIFFMHILLALLIQKYVPIFPKKLQQQQTAVLLAMLVSSMYKLLVTLAPCIS